MTNRVAAPTLGAMNDTVVKTLSLLVLGLAGLAHAGDQADWDRFEIKGVKLGDSLEKVKKLGFKEGTYRVTTSRMGRHFIKIYDACEKAKSCKVAGNDETVVMKGGERSHPAHNPVEYVDVQLTDLDAPQPRVQSISYFFPRQFIKEDSPLGLALQKKYGPHCTSEPDCYRTDLMDKDGGGKMMFTSPTSSVYLVAYCGGDAYGSDVTRQCRISVDDTTIFQADEEARREAQQAEGEKKQPAAPEL